MMATLEENISQAIADFDDIEAAIEEQGVDVPYGTDTKEYGNLIRQKLQLKQTVDQTYNPESSNAQSGIAVAEALASQPIKTVESPDADGNYLNLYDLESGMYVLSGRFYVYPNATKRFVFNRSLFVAVSHGSISTCVQVIYPPYNTIQYLNIYPPDEEAGTDYTYERKDAELYYMEDVRQKVAEINGLSDDEHYPSAKAVYDAVNSNTLHGKASGEVIRVDDVNPIEHKVKAKAGGKNLFNPEIFAETETRNGVTISRDGNKFTVNGTATASFSFETTSFSWNIPKPSSLSLEYLSGSLDVILWFSLRDDYNNHLQSRINTDGTTAYYPNSTEAVTRAWFWIENGTTFDNLTFTVQLEKGEVATEHEPYVDPSTVTVTRCGKNILSYPYANSSFTAQGVTVTVNEDGTLDLSGTASATQNFYFRENEDITLPEGTYTVSLGGDFTCDNEIRLWLYKTSIAEQVAYISYPRESKFTFTVTKAISFNVYIMIMGGSTVGGTMKVQIEKGEAVTEYESYNGTTYTPEADGTVNGITSLSPTMTLLTDKAGVTIEAEYNQDINAAFDKINAILETLLNGGA